MSLFLCTLSHSALINQVFHVLLSGSAELHCHPSSPMCLHTSPFILQAASFTPSRRRVCPHLESFIRLMARKSGQELLMRGIRLMLTIHLHQPILLRAEGQLRRTTSLLKRVELIRARNNEEYNCLINKLINSILKNPLWDL